MAALDTAGFNSPLGYNTPSFGTTSQQDFGKAIALQSNGKIIMVGTILDSISGNYVVGITRFNSNGSLDTSFGSSGFVIGPPLYVTPPATNLGIVNVADVVIDSSDNIYITGALYTLIIQIFIIKYSSTGILDTSFGSPNGYIITIPSSFGLYANCEGKSIKIDTTISPNKIVVTGNVYTGSNNNIGLSRYELNGVVDTSFGSGGFVVYNNGNSNTSDSLAITSSGDYVVSGAEIISGNFKFLIAEFNTFGTLSWITVFPSFQTGSSDQAYSVKIQSDGKIVAGGYGILPGSESFFAVCRLLSNGTIDTSFGNAGQIYTDLSGSPTPIWLTGNSLDIQADGKIVLGGTYQIQTTFEESFALARYLPNGSLDLTFGVNNNGLILEDLISSPMKEQGTSLIIQPNGLILLAGVRGIFADVDEKWFIIAQYFGFPPFPPPIPPGPGPGPVPVVPICFPAGTPVLTDQGYIPIEQINPELNTIRNKTIVAITKTITNHDKIVCFEKHSLGYNVPNQRTLVSLNHGIIYNKKIIPAKKFVGRKHGIYFKKYNGEYLYNVLMETHMAMLVNNMKVETLDPKNIVAKLYTNKYSPEQKEKIILQINNFSHDHYNKYRNFHNYDRLQFNRTRRNYEVHSFNPILGKLHLRTQKNYSFFNNILKEQSRIDNHNHNHNHNRNHNHNQTIRYRAPLKNNSMIKINTNVLHRFTRYGRKKR
jgi:uncharacterized delta-60 repeat protein